MKQGERKIYRVAELTRLVKNTLESTFGEVWIEGEVSNVRCPSSGHYYFTIKDDTAQISAVMFRGNQRALRFKLKDGLMVQAFGQISVYERSGNYQIIVRQMEESGKGSLQAAFEKLKKKLGEEGLFAEERKRPLPMLSQHIGVVTSPTGAAIRDILKVMSRRFPNLHVVLAPVRVQGESAAGEIAAAIKMLNARGGLDVMIVGRGGGSIEDLWCFNEEIVARAIADSCIPVISAVGHEIDFTISDFVADLRAPTPSAAAERVVGKKEILEQRLSDMRLRQVRSLRECLAGARNRLLAVSRSYVFAQPRDIVRSHRQHVGELALRIRHASTDKLHESVQRLDDANLRVLHAMQSATQRGEQDVKRLGAQLRALNPRAVLVRGFSITMDAKQRVLRSPKELRQGEHVRTVLAEGEFESEVVTEGGEMRKQVTENVSKEKMDD